MIHKEIEALVEQGNINELQRRMYDVAKCIEYEIREEYTDPDLYLVYQIAKCPNHTTGRVMFQILKRACADHSPYHWYEIMRTIGYPMMLGAAISQNIKLLEHAMAHVDEIELEKLIHNVDLPEVEKWYDENFVIT